VNSLPNPPAPRGDQAFVTGGAYALLFVLGVMNLIWIALLSAFVLVEKILPSPRWFRALAGCAFIGWGIALLV